MDYHEEYHTNKCLEENGWDLKKTGRLETSSSRTHLDSRCCEENEK